MTYRFRLTLLFCLLSGLGIVPLPHLLAEPSETSAWEAYQRANPASALKVGSTERRLLERLTVEQARAFAEGADPYSIELTDGTTLAEALRGIPMTFDLSWWTIDSGGGTATGGGYTLFGTLGQPDAGTVASGNGFTLVGGFTPLKLALFLDGFESGGTNAWDQTSGGV